ncbi:MAG: ROK family transcriptional regulator [Anaerolineales bacterium]
MTKIVPGEGWNAETSIRVINRKRVLTLILYRPGLTRTALAEACGLSNATVSSLVAELLEEGVLHEHDEGGRLQRNRTLWLNRNAGCAIGIELSPRHCRAVLADMEMNVVSRVERALPNTLVDDTIRALADVVQELRAGANAPLLGVAVAVPGPNDLEGQRVVFSESLGWSDVALAERLGALTGCPVSVINRPKAGVLGEHWYGAGQGIDNLVYVSVSSGIAAGIFIDGQLFTGAFGYGGELGHTTILDDGPQCVCGNRGCLEAVASLPAIAAAVCRRIRAGEPCVLSEPPEKQAPYDYEPLIAAARNGDLVVCEEIRAASRYLGIAVANLINLFNPQMVILGGQLALAGEIVLETVRETAQRRAFPLSFRHVQIVASALRGDSACLGACASVVAEHINRLGARQPLSSTANR